MADLIKYQGGCHCGAILFEVWAPKAPAIIRCNCSICNMKQNHHFIVPKSSFTLLKGADKITTYTFNTHIAKHTFCSLCGVQSFYSPRSNPGGYGIMPHCIFGDAMDKSNVQIFNGSHWEEEIQTKSHIKSYSNQ